MPSASARKGANYERELADHISQRLNHLLPHGVHRMPLSGGGSWSAYNKQGDADLIGLPGLHIEAKRVEALRIHEAMLQAKTSVSARSASDIPTVVTRRNRQTTGQSYVVLELDDFLSIYEAYLAHGQHITKQ